MIFFLKRKFPLLWFPLSFLRFQWSLSPILTQWTKEIYLLDSSIAIISYLGSLILHFELHLIAEILYQQWAILLPQILCGCRCFAVLLPLDISQASGYSIVSVSHHQSSGLLTTSNFLQSRIYRRELNSKQVIDCIFYLMLFS